MKAEREVTFGPRLSGRKVAHHAEPPRYRRGEREAQTLKRRRRLHRLRLWVARGAFGAFAGVVFVCWMTGTAERIARDAEAFLRAQAVQAGLVVGRIEVTGLEHLDRGEVLEALAVRPGMPILDIDLAEAQTRVQSIGWVRSVAVARRLPDTLQVTVSERTPAALWQHGGVLTLIDSGGHPITTVGLGAHAHLPHVVGPGAGVAAAGLIPVLEREPVLGARMRAAVRVGERRWDIVFRNGVRARLPESGEAAAWSRLAALEREHRILSREIHVIDLRQPDRLVLRLTEREIRRRRDAVREANEKGGQV